MTWKIRKLLIKKTTKMQAIGSDLKLENQES